MMSRRVMAFTQMVSRRFFLSKELKIDMSRLKSIWGLMLGILLLGVNRPIWAGLTSSVVKHVKAHEDR